LALPLVRNYLVQELSGGAATAAERITLAFDERGFRCRVGDATILCVHGNEVDPWNVTDWETLRKIGHDPASGIGWTPNGGSKLVIDVMNEIKADHPFVDLLKPESEAVLPTLAILRPGLLSKIGAAAPSWFRSRWDELQMTFGFLGEGAVPCDGRIHNAALHDRAARHSALRGGDLHGGALGDGVLHDGSLPGRGRPREAAVLGQMLGAALREDTLAKRGAYDLDHLLEETELRLRRGTTPLDLAARRDDYLGLTGAIWNLVRRRGKSEVLREALEQLAKDRSFSRQTADATYYALDKEITTDVDFVVVGHTHLERAVPLRGEHRYYYNSGTWVRLMQIPPEVLRSEQNFLPVFKALEE
jgi:hypothetical protein